MHVAAGSPVRQMSLHIAPFERKRIAIVFADLSDFVSFTEREGDTVAAQLLLLNVLTGTSIANCRGGRVVKHLGDGFLAWFPDPAQAVLASVELARAGSDILPMRIGAHWGHAVVTPHDVIGGTVNLAARVLDLAAPGEVLVTDALRHAAGVPEGVSYGRQRTGLAKGIRARFSVSAASSATCEEES